MTSGFTDQDMTRWEIDRLQKRIDDLYIFLILCPVGVRLGPAMEIA